jgi:DNA-binding CsgD family transcriptional regulator
VTSSCSSRPQSGVGLPALCHSVRNPVHLGKSLASRSKGVAPQDAGGWLSLVMQTDGLAMIVDLRDLSIAAVSDALRALLSDGPEQTVLGAHVYEFMANPPSGGLGMMARGVIEGYEAQNSLKLPRHAPRPITGWMRVIGEERPARYALMVLRAQGENRSGGALLEPAAEESPIVLGVGDRNLAITHVTADIERLVGAAAEEVLGRQLLSLFDEETVPAALWVLAQALQAHSSAAGFATIMTVERGALPVDFVVCGALHPSPNFGFAFVPKRDPLLRPEDQDALRAVARADRAAAVYRRFPEMAIDPTLMSRLTFRELEIASLLLRGHRTPSIAQALHLSQSTVRNHLSSVFAKAGVHSQHELIDKLRRRASQTRGPLR